MECLNERIKKLAEKIKVNPSTLKMLVYSNYGDCMNTPEQNLAVFEEYYNNKKN